MLLSTRAKGAVIFVDAAGALTIGESASALRNTMRELAWKRSEQVVLNMAGVTRVDSSGIGELISSYTAITSAGGKLKLLNLARHVSDLLKVNRLDTVFDTLEDEASAVAAFSLS